MTPLILREGEPARLVGLPRAIADALGASGACTVALTHTPGVWEVAAGTRVGALRVGDLDVIIKPKIDINRVIFLMGYASRPDFWRDEGVHLDPDADLPDALAATFARLARRALDQGLRKGYVTVEESLPVLRGRIREADQLRRHWGRGIPLDVRYDDYTVDIAENQLLLAATEVLLRLPRVGVRLRAELRRLRLQLADVTPPARGAPPPTWTPTRLNARYAPALRVAELVVAGRSFEQRGGEVTISGFLLNMATIFEDFVTAALRDALAGFGGRAQAQYPAMLDEASMVPIRPDIVWTWQGRPVVVADAKYKAEKPAGFPQADLYQMLAYCTALGLPEGHLVYARGHEDAARHVIRGSGVRVTAHALDLDVEPVRLLAAVSALADSLVAEAGCPAVGGPLHRATDAARGTPTGSRPPR